MPIDFPSSPSAGVTYSYGGILWTYNGVAWDKNTSGSISTYVATLNGLSGGVNVAAGTSISVTPSGNTLTIAYTGTGGGGGSGPTMYVESFNGLTGAVTGVTLGGAAFTGLVSSTTGFSGPGTNLTGNASGLTAGTATAVNISTSNTATTQYLVFASGVGGKTLGIDSTASPLTYVPSTGSLSVGSSTTSSLSATSVNTTTIYGPNTDTLTLTNGGSGVAIEDSGGGLISLTNSLSSINLDSPNSIRIGDISGIGSGGFVRISDNLGTVDVSALTFNAEAANFTGTLTGVTANFTGRVSSTVGFSGPGTNITGVVTSFNNQTGAVIGVTVGGTNVFTALNSFNVGISASGGVTLSGNVAMTSISSHTGLASFASGISASGGTFANDIRVNSMTIGRGSANDSRNIAIGASAYFSGTTGYNNVAIGSNALKLNQAGDVNTAIGAGALQSNINGRNNVALGWNALNTLNTTTWSAAGQAEYNVGIGGNALGAATIGSYNIAIGAAAAQALTTSNSNIAIGTYSLLKCGAGGGDNTTIGHQSMLGSGSATTQTYNTSIGANSMFSIATANYNTAIGHSALFTSTTGQYNTIIGAFALYHATAPNYAVAVGQEAGRYAGSAGATLSSSTNSIYIGSGSKSGFTTSSNEIVIGSNALGLGSNTTVIGLTATTSATIYGLVNAPSGISASGATFSGNINLQNQEFIRNTTNGRMDFMPAPAGSTHYGMYMDFTSWSYGVKLGTIRASDSALNTGPFLWDAPLSINDDVGFNLGSDGQYNIVRTIVGNDTAQFSVNCSTGQNSGAFAIVDNLGQQQANRSPGVTHANPNLYVYRSGSARATDFIRIEHNGTNGRIVSGGTTGISLEPGSGVVEISGGISLSSGITFADQTYQISKTPDFLLFSMGIV